MFKWVKGHETREDGSKVLPFYSLIFIHASSRTHFPRGYGTIALTIEFLVSKVNMHEVIRKQMDVQLPRTNYNFSSFNLTLFLRLQYNYNSSPFP